MAAVLAGMTVLQLAQLAGALLGGADSLVRLHEDLKASGVQDHELVPGIHLPTIITTMSKVYDAARDNTSDDFINNTLGR
jgi:hypothetical protein